MVQLSQSDGGLATWGSHGKRDPRERHAATRFGHLSRTKDDVCDDDKVAVMQAPTCESLALKRVEINAVKTELHMACSSGWRETTPQ